MASADAWCCCRSQWLVGLVINLWMAGYYISDGYILGGREGKSSADGPDNDVAMDKNSDSIETDIVLTLHNTEARQQQQFLAVGGKAIPSVALGDGYFMGRNKDLFAVQKSRLLPQSGYQPQAESHHRGSFSSMPAVPLRPPQQTWASDVCLRIPLCRRMLIRLAKNTNRNISERGGLASLDPHRIPITPPQTNLPTADTSVLGRISTVETTQIGRKPITQLTEPSGQLQSINHGLSPSLIRTLLKQIGGFLHKLSAGNGVWTYYEQLPPHEKQQTPRRKRDTSAGEQHNGTTHDNFIGSDSEYAAPTTQKVVEVASDKRGEQNKTVDSHEKYSNISDPGLSYRSMVGLVDSPGVAESPRGRGTGERSSPALDAPIDEPDIPSAHDSPRVSGQLVDAYVNESTVAPIRLSSTEKHVMMEQSGLFESTAMPETPELEPTAQETDILMAEPKAEHEVEPTVSLPILDSEPEPEPEPELEPEWNPEGEAEWTSEAEPSDTDTGGCNPCLAEPEPDWVSAKMEWQVAWEIHVYGVGILFAILAAYSFFSILRLYRKKNLLCQGYFIALNSMLLLIGVCRAVFFLVDGYNTNGIFHRVVAYFLYSIGFPCLTSAFSIIFLALLQTLQMQPLSPRIQTTPVLISVIALHFILSIVTDIIMGYISGSKLMLLICQIVFVLWGLFLFCGYIYIFKNLHQSAIRRQKSMMKLMVTTTDSDLNSSGLKGKIQMRFPLNVAIVVTMVTAIFGLACAGLQIYAMVGAYSIFSSETPDAWPWWGFMLGLRITELCMCATMSFVATQPFRYRVQHDSSSGCGCWTLFFTMPCCRLCDTTQVEDEKVEWNNFEQVFQELGSSTMSTTSRGRTLSIRYSETTEETSALHHCPPQNGDPCFTRDNCHKHNTLPLCKFSKHKPRPKSMLVYENGFIRFRHEGDPEGEPVASTDDELDSVDLSGRSSHRDHNGVAQWAEGGAGGGHSVARPMLHNVLNGKHVSGMSTPATPATPRSFASTDLDGLSDVFSFKAPSSIHLRESIERALDDNDCPRFSLRTPDYLDYEDPNHPDTYYSMPNTPDSMLDANIGFESLGDISMKSRHSFKSKGAYGSSPHGSRSSHDLKCKSQWIHKSPRHYWNKVKPRGSNISLNQALATRYAHLDDTDSVVLRRKMKHVHRYRSKSDSLAESEFYSDDICEV